MRKAVIHWEVDGRTGHGEPVTEADVGVAFNLKEGQHSFEGLCRHLNEKHGAGTPWCVLVEGGTE